MTKKGLHIEKSLQGWICSRIFAFLAEPGHSDSLLNCVSLTDFDFFNLNCQFYHRREEIFVCYFSYSMVSFRFHYNNSGFDLWYFLNEFFVFCENPQRTVRADELRVWGSRGSPRGTCIPLHVTSSMDRRGLCSGMHGEEVARASPWQPQNWGDPICHPHLANTKGHSRGLLKFSSMRKQEGNRSNMSQEKSSPATSNPPAMQHRSIQARTNVHSYISNPPADRKPNLQKKPNLKFNFFG